MDTHLHLAQSQTKPVLTQFLSITSYLQSYYSFRKAGDSEFSYENWASELNFKSRSSLRMMAFGKRNVSEKLMESFARREKLSEKETMYLTLLSKLQNTKNLTLKKIFLDQISELTDFSIKKTEIQNAFDFLTAPEMYLVQILISFEDFQATLSSLQSILTLDAGKIQQTLSKLEKLGLIEAYQSEISKEKVWKSKAKFFSVMGDLEQTAIDIFHRQTLKETEKIIQQDILDKKLKSLFFSLGEADYADLVETIDQFTNKLKVKYANDFIQNKKVYKINLQVYPVTEKCETTSSIAKLD